MIRRSQLVEQVNRKSYSLLFVFTIMAVILLLTAFRIQVIEGQDNLVVAGAINRNKEIIRAPRGLIYDSQGRQLVKNQPSFNLYALPSEVDLENLEKEFDSIGQAFSVPKEKLLETFNDRAYNADGELVGERVTLIYGLKYEKFLENFEIVKNAPGVYIASESIRSYQFSQGELEGYDIKSLSHIIGYIGDINREEYEQMDLDVNARVGKEGLEKIYDEKLRGEDGFKLSERVGGSVNSWIPKSDRSGENLYLTINMDWQQKLYQNLEKHVNQNGAFGGAGVIVETDTGKVRALVSYPSFDLEAFARGISGQEFQSLLNDQRSPLLNRAISMQIPPGSVFKIAMASALQQEQVINKDSVYKSGCFELTEDYRLCEADNRNYGQLNMTGALARSSNPYFCQASIDMVSKFGSDEVAITKLNEYFQNFGFGQKTPIDLPGAQPGVAPSPAEKLRLQGEPWYLADMCNTAIGQGLVSVTPLQMSMAVAAVENGGKVYKPVLVEKFEDADLQVSMGESGVVVSEVGVQPGYLANVREGMAQAAEYGTARGLKGKMDYIIAKTGSSEATVRTDSGEIIEGAHSWVVGAFEYEGKKYAFAVAQQFGGRGYKSVPIIGEFFDYLKQ